MKKLEKAIDTISKQAVIKVLKAEAKTLYDIYREGSTPDEFTSNDFATMVYDKLQGKK